MNNAAHNPATHLPVMLDEVLDFLRPQEGNLLVDCTLGLAGHSRAFSIPEVLEFLSLTNKTGTLQVATKLENFVLEFEGGEVVHASSDSAPAGDADLG